MNDKPSVMNIGYLASLPGVFVCVQLVLSFVAFVTSISSTSTYKMNASHGFFSFITFLVTLSCIVWVFIHVFKIEALFKKDINWNLVGILHNSVWGFFVMAASWAMVDMGYNRSLRAAGVFGFLAYSTFVAALVWELTLWQQQRQDEDLPTATAQVVPGLRPGSRGSSRASSTFEVQGEIAQDDWNSEAPVGFLGMKTRPTSAFEH